MSHSNLVYSSRDATYLPEHADKNKAGSALIGFHIESRFQVGQKYCRFSSKGEFASSNIGGVLDNQCRVDRRTSHKNS